MARSKNQVDTVNVTLAMTPKMVEYLKHLVETGFYGKNHAEAAERLLAQALEQKHREYGKDWRDSFDE
ncbi:MAG: hypothetical protein KZQ97_04335 [Candidatus Thiodiazotropha sp. (ex Dulcina madagascariensis)]|nr:hypothetical protein [Candidatus Thiodiazotropha sp. (ex Dulcina madagascariensis)]